MNYRFAIAGLRALFGVLSKAVKELQYLDKVRYGDYLFHVVFIFNCVSYLGGWSRIRGNLCKDDR